MEKAEAATFFRGEHKYYKAFMQPKVAEACKLAADTIEAVERLESDRDALAADNARLRKAMEQAFEGAARQLAEPRHHGNDQYALTAIATTCELALAATPAQSLAAHDAAVKVAVLDQVKARLYSLASKEQDQPYGYDMNPRQWAATCLECAAEDVTAMQDEIISEADASRRSPRMAERPILFSGDMVRAILAGRKTQTRRVVKGSRCKDSGAPLAPCEIAAEVNGGDYRLCPYGVPGDTLWVREKHWIVERDGQGIDVPFLVYDDEWERGVVSLGTPLRPWVGPFEKYGPRPSIHMPRWASRITLRVTGVRVERLQEISEDDAKAEGVTYSQAMEIGDSYTGGFRALWHTIHAADGPHGWEANPWVWVVEFEKEAPHA